MRASLRTLWEARRVGRDGTWQAESAEGASNQAAGLSVQASQLTGNAAEKGFHQTSTYEGEVLKHERQEFVSFFGRL